MTSSLHLLCRNTRRKNSSRACIAVPKKSWRTRLATAELRPAPDGTAVGFGTRVSYRLNGKVRQVDIVGDDEADPNAGRVSFSSPLARAMMDAEKGDQVDFNGRTDAIEIMSIGVIDES